MVDYGPQTRMNTTTVATALQRRWACHTRTVLPADAFGRQCCNVVLSACSVVYPWYMSCGLCVRERGQQKQTNFTGSYVQNRPHTEKPGKSSYPFPAKKVTLRARHASYSARMELKPRPQVPYGLPVST